MARAQVDGQLVLAGAAPRVPGAGSGRQRTAFATADLVVTGDVAALGDAPDGAVAGQVIGAGAIDGALIEDVIHKTRQGATVVLVSGGGAAPAGGHRLVAAAYEAGVPVTVVPGASPVIAALALSGLPAERFLVESHLPRTAPQRRARLIWLAGQSRTIIVLEQAERLAGTLADLCRALGGDRPAALCVHPASAGAEARRSTLSTLGDTAPDPGGELVVLVIAGGSADDRTAPDLAALREAVAARVAAGQSRRDAVEAVARQHGLRRRQLYEATLDI